MGAQKKNSIYSHPSAYVSIPLLTSRLPDQNFDKRKYSAAPFIKINMQQFIAYG